MQENSKRKYFAIPLTHFQENIFILYVLLINSMYFAPNNLYSPEQKFQHAKIQ